MMFSFNLSPPKMFKHWDWMHITNPMRHLLICFSIIMRITLWIYLQNNINFSPCINDKVYLHVIEPCIIWWGQAVVCFVDDDECKCSKNSIGGYVDGRYVCKCNQGFRGDGFTCISNHFNKILRPSC